MRDSYHIIEEKLRRFIRKYYLNELIKGSILFVSLGVLYLFFVLWIEDLLWLSPRWRLLLFWLFIGVEAGLLMYYLVRPLVKLSGLTRRISPEEASRMIGKHFPGIDDKLLNLLQLQHSGVKEELVLASIEQKAGQLRPYPFHKAVKFAANSKYIKYLAIPLLLWMVFRLTGKTGDLGESYKRITHPQVVYVPPAPFRFEVENGSLQVLENEPVTIRVSISGESLPGEVRLLTGKEVYYMKSASPRRFYYSLPPAKKSFTFVLEGGGVRSPEYRVEVLPVPRIKDIRMELDYPSYTGKKDETIRHTGNAIIPEGTRITWYVSTQNTDSLTMRRDSVVRHFSNGTGDLFRLTQLIRRSGHYRIETANRYLKNYESLSFSLRVITDEFPGIQVQSERESPASPSVMFGGRVTDDYGIAKLQMVYYPAGNPAGKSRIDIPVHGGGITGTFFYKFPGDADIPAGVDYELYFEVFDNDAVNGSKSTKSKVFSLHLDTETERKEKILQEEKQRLEEMEKNLRKQQENRRRLETLQKDLLEKPRMDFDDKKKLEQFLQRREQYQEMMQRQAEQIQKNLQRQPETSNPMLEEKKEDIERRIEEYKNLEKEKQMLEELRRLAEKMQREDLIDKIKKMSSNHKQKEKSLEQLLELTKRFYVEQKQQQIIDKLNELAGKQEKLAGDKDNNKAKQDSLNRSFDRIRKDIEELQKENQKLKEPMDIDPHEQEQEDIHNEQQQASENLQQNKMKSAEQNQKQAARKMRQMAQGMQMMMNSASAQMIEEDIDSLRRIIENLIVFSYDQEELMLQFDEQGKDLPGYAEKLKYQYRLKTFFEHIDDSLYVLAMRQPKISQKINEPLSNAHYYLEESLQHLADFLVTKGVSDQHYVMTAANDLALLLSLMLDNMQSSLGMGQGQGQGMGQGMGQGKGQGKGFQLPDIIKKQGELGQKMQQGMQQGEQGEEGPDGKKEGEKGKGEKSGKQEGQGGGNDGKGNGTSEEQMQELYEIYKQQAMLRQALEKQLEDMQGDGIRGQAQKVVKKMEELERMLLERGITQDVMQQLRNLQHELLKLKKAVNEQGMEQKRKSETPKKTWDKPSPAEIKFKKKYLPEDEILNREPLPLKALYKKKVQEYFKTSPETE